MKVICAWCNVEIGSEDGDAEMRYSVCKKCLAKFRNSPKSNDEIQVTLGKTDPDER